MYTLPLQPFRDCRIIIFEGGFWARGLEYELKDDFCYTPIVICTLGVIQISADAFFANFGPPPPMLSNH